jgi:hypothetical protein
MHDRPKVEDLWPMKPPLPDGTGEWPQPTEAVYPMKPSDTLLADGVLHSGGLGRVKAEQHDEKIVVEWSDDYWVVRRVPPPASERIDIVVKDAAATAWRRAARRHQSNWRVVAGWPAGRQRINRSDPPAWRPIGSRCDPLYATRTGCNFLDAHIVEAVRDRLQQPQPHQTLDQERLWSDLLSSMPMCFNLFGTLWKNPSLAADAVQRWFPHMALPDSTVSVHFEWSPGRRDPYWLGDRTAFDAMIEIVTNERRHLIGIETKYHEHPTAVRHDSAPPGRYLEIAEAADLCAEATIRAQIWGSAVEQVWRDHLLALACGQHADGWDRVHYVLAAPERNPSWEHLVDDYRSLLHPHARRSVEYRSIESLIEQASDLLPQADAFKARYLDVDPFSKHRNRT